MVAKGDMPLKDVSLSRGAAPAGQEFLCRPLQTGRPGMTRSAAAGDLSHRSDFEIGVAEDRANVCRYTA
jgi:hypothetical protein